MRGSALTLALGAAALLLLLLQLVTRSSTATAPRQRSPVAPQATAVDDSLEFVDALGAEIVWRKPGADTFNYTAFVDRHAPPAPVARHWLTTMRARAVYSPPTKSGGSSTTSCKQCPSSRSSSPPLPLPSGTSSRFANG